MKPQLCLLALACLAQPAEAKDLSPTQIGEIFCMARLAGDMAPVEGLLSPVLAAAIAYAQARSDMIARAYPHEKPPLGDGVPWQSFPDQALTCSVGEPSHAATATGLPISYGFPDQGDAGWIDTLVLVPVEITDGEAPRLRIDDIIYGDGSSLLGALAVAFAE